MGEIKAVFPETAVFHAPSYFKTVVVFASGTTVLQVMEAVLVDFIERFDINIEHWKAGQRLVENAVRLGRPTVTDLVALRNENITSGYFSGASDGAFGFDGAQILDQVGSADDDSYGHTDTVSLCVSARDLSADTTPNRTRNDIDSHHALVRALITRFPVLRAHIYRSSNIYAPAPPHSEAHYLLYIAHRADIIQSYDNPDDYWNAWDVVEPLDDNRVLVTRALNIDDELEFKAHVYPRIWQLARVARPKLTRYAMPNVREHDKPYYYGPDDVTSPVGYYPPEQWVEFTAFPPENGHVLPRDIHDFRRWLRQKKMDDGKPLKEIRVTFHKLAVAEREKRPLLDIGCRVFGYNDNGDLVELTQ